MNTREIFCDGVFLSLFLKWRGGGHIVPSAFRLVKTRSSYYFLGVKLFIHEISAINSIFFLEGGRKGLNMPF